MEISSTRRKRGRCSQDGSGVDEMDDTPTSLTGTLDRLGQLFDDIIFPVLAAWAIYLGKGFLVKLANKLGLPPNGESK